MWTMTMVGTEAVPLQVKAVMYPHTKAKLDFAGNISADVRRQLEIKLFAHLRRENTPCLNNTGSLLDEYRTVLSFEPSNVPVGPEVEAGCLLAMYEELAWCYGVGEWAADMAWVGEYSIDGRAQPLQNALAYAMRADQEGKALALPEVSANEIEALGKPCYAIPDLTGLQALAGVVSWISLQPWAQGPKFDGRETLLYTPHPLEAPSAAVAECIDLAEVKGQALAKRAVEIAAAGGHNLLLVGPPGQGKSMLSKALPGILPPLHGRPSVEATHIHRMKGLLRAEDGLLVIPPFVQIDRNTTQPALLGSGFQVLKPGAVSLAHQGVLYLDELHQATKPLIEALRQPLEDGYVVVQRSSWTAKVPAKFIFVTSTNPCPCGFLGHPTRPCRCTASEVRRYQVKLSGPLLDRVPLTVLVKPLTDAEYKKPPAAESSATVRGRIVQARILADRRGWRCNDDIPASQLREAVRLTRKAATLETEMAERHQLSTRGRDHLLKVGRTIADLAASEVVDAKHIEEAAVFCDRDLLFSPGR